MTGHRIFQSALEYLSKDVYIRLRKLPDSALRTDRKKSFREFLEEYLKETDILHSKHAAVTFIAISLILLSIVTLILETDKAIFAKYGPLLLFIDGLIMVIFTLEYIASLDDYYRTIVSLAKQIKYHLTKRQAPITVLNSSTRVNSAPTSQSQNN